MTSVLQFYALTAQVLPVLFVILSVEFGGVGYLPEDLTEVHRGSPLHDMDSHARLRLTFETKVELGYTVFLMALLVVAEVTTLAAVGNGTESLAVTAVAWAALGGAAGATIMPLGAVLIRRLLDLGYQASFGTARPIWGASESTRRPALFRAEGVAGTVILIALIAGAVVVVVELA